ncbi:hypothetical protein [Alteromonas macleodii]|uniref:hypothetical protein n=1 Tax=Alteromonas macleodii TaxID=28108 RepID=UPI0008595BAA|nr:hypothetical protein [Alteromonas macleodii]OES24103.1 hypothetical protein BFV93_4856 [Alteromonas macleodii]
MDRSLVRLIQTQLLVLFIALLAPAVVCAQSISQSAAVPTQQTLQQMMDELRALKVDANAQPTKQAALQSLRSAITQYCKSLNLTFEQCSSASATDMQAWYQARQKQMARMRQQQLERQRQP